MSFLFFSKFFKKNFKEKSIMPVDSRDNFSAILLLYVVIKSYQQLFTGYQHIILLIKSILVTLSTSC